MLYGDSVHSWTRLREAASWLHSHSYDGLSIAPIPRQVMNIHTFTNLQLEGTKWTLLAILEQTYNGFHATNTRDKIYGVLGLCTEAQGTEWPASLVPLYQLPEGRVFQDVARFLIETTRSLAVLSFVCMGGRRDDMPSWVPDLTGSTFYRGLMNQMFRDDHGRVELRNREGYAACLESTLTSKLGSNPDTLELRGVQIDTVVSQLEENYALSWPMQECTADQRDQVRPFYLKTANDQIERFKSTGRLGTCPESSLIMENGALSPSLLRIWMSMADSSRKNTLLGVKALARSFLNITVAGQGQIGYTFRSEEEVAQSFRNCCAYLVKALKEHVVDPSSYHRDWLEEWSTGGDPDIFYGIAHKWCQGRRFFRTSAGGWGMGPGPMREGDVLCILFGGGVPYILRQKGSRYIFIGDCYADGVMEGQAMRLISNDRDVKLFEII